MAAPRDNIVTTVTVHVVETALGPAAHAAATARVQAVSAVDCVLVRTAWKGVFARAINVFKAAGAPVPNAIAVVDASDPTAAGVAAVSRRSLATAVREAALAHPALIPTALVHGAIIRLLSRYPRPLLRLLLNLLA